jgi:DNA polymerase I-like protein with 3'-5' exonuclease and polymerase domains
MKATELIAELQKLVDYNKDVEVRMLVNVHDEGTFEIDIDEVEYNDLTSIILLS